MELSTFTFAWFLVPLLVMLLLLCTRCESKPLPFNWTSMSGDVKENGPKNFQSLENKLKLFDVGRT